MATDPREKVFALLSLQNLRTGDHLGKADYGKSVTEVYIETAVWLLKWVGLRFLSCCGTMRENEPGKLEGLPSWMPYWSQRYPEQWMIGSGNGRWDKYTFLRAGGDPPEYSNSKAVLATTVATTAINRGIHNRRRVLLKVRGVFVDRIRFVSGQINIRSAGDKECENFVERCRLYRETLFKNHAEGPGRVMGAAFLPLPRHGPKTGQTRHHPPDWAAYEYGLPFKHPENLKDSKAGEYIDFFTVNRQLAMADRGYFGVFPQESEVGDQACCFLSAGVPFILRGKDDGTYRLMGEPYIYGLIEGEAFGGADKANEMTKTQTTVPIEPLQDFLIS